MQAEKNERGVGVILKQDPNECFPGYSQQSVKLKGELFNISTIMVCAPTAQITEK